MTYRNRLSVFPGRVTRSQRNGGRTLCVWMQLVRHITMLSLPLDTALFHRRNQDVWGSDTHQFRPERCFEIKEQVESPVGMDGNLHGHGHVFNSDRPIGY